NRGRCRQMNAAVISGLLASYGIAIPIGAIAIFLIRLGATACLCIGTAAGLGAATVDGGFALAAVAGGAELARPGQAVPGRARWAAGTLLTLVAAWMALSHPPARPVTPCWPGRPGKARASCPRRWWPRSALRPRPARGRRRRRRR